jgi:hypothetical protein
MESSSTTIDNIPFFSDKSRMFFGIPAQFEGSKRYLLSEDWQELVEVKNDQASEG